MSNPHPDTGFHERVSSWVERCKPKKDIQDGFEVAKGMSSDDSSNQGHPRCAIDNGNKNRKFFHLKDLIHIRDGWCTRARKFLDKALPNIERCEEVQAEYRPRLHVGTFNIMRNLTGLYHGPPLWQDLYIYFTTSSSIDQTLNQKPTYNYYYTLKPEANRAKQNFKVEENICDQHNMSKRKRRYCQKKNIEPFVIYKQEFAVRPGFRHFSSIVDLHYRRFKEEYYRQPIFGLSEGLPASEILSSHENYPEYKKRLLKRASFYGDPLVNEEIQLENNSPSQLSTIDEEPEPDQITPAIPAESSILTMQSYDHIWAMGMII